MTAPLSWGPWTAGDPHAAPQVTILVCPHCTLPVVECPCESAQADPGCGGYVHVLTGAHSCNPRNLDCPYYAQNPRRVTK